MSEVDATWDPSSEGGLTISSLLVGRALRICSITAGEQPTDLRAEDVEALGFAQDSGFGLEFELIPAEDPAPPEDAEPDALAAYSERNQWWLIGQDDLGTEYDVPSWVTGPSPDGTTTRGVLDIYPTPPPGAKWIDFAFHGDGYRHGYADDAGRRFVLRVPLPIPVVSFEQSLGEMGVSQARLMSATQAALQLAQNYKNAENREDRVGEDWVTFRENADESGSSRSE